MKNLSIQLFFFQLQLSTLCSVTSAFTYSTGRCTCTGSSITARSSSVDSESVGISIRQSLTKLDVRRSKWDDLVDEDEDYDDIPVAPDMTYEPRNVKRAHENFLGIRGTAGKEMTNDVYVRDPKTEVFWYAGKVARISDVTLEQCIARQWPMIEKHACHLRPIELYPKRARLEIWTAPGDSEMDVAYNRPTLQFQKMEREVEGAKNVKKMFVGFQGEIYQDGEDGFRTWRTNEGLPARPELNPGGESRPPTVEELAQLQKEMNINTDSGDGEDIYDV